MAGHNYSIESGIYTGLFGFAVLMKKLESKGIISDADVVSILKEVIQQRPETKDAITSIWNKLVL